MLESINALRRDVCRNGSDRTVRLVADHIGKIEQEINERYIEMPKDADGKPIRVGDKLMNDHTEQVITVTQVAMSSDGWYVHTDHGILGLLEHLHHYEPPTVEAMLESALNTAAMLDSDSGYLPSAADITNIVNEIAPKLQLREEE